MNRYDYADVRIAGVEQAKLVHNLHALQASQSLFAEGTFMGVEINNLKENVRAAAVNAALPQPDHLLRWDLPFQELVKPAKELTGLCEKGTFGTTRELPQGYKKISVMFVNLAKDDDKCMFEKISFACT